MYLKIIGIIGFLHVHKVQRRIKYRYGTIVYKIIISFYFHISREMMTVTRTASTLLSAAKKTVSEKVVSWFTLESASGQQSLTVNNGCLH